MEGNISKKISQIRKDLKKYATKKDLEVVRMQVVENTVAITEIKQELTDFHKEFTDFRSEAARGHDQIIDLLKHSDIERIAEIAHVQRVESVVRRHDTDIKQLKTHLHLV